MYLTLRGIFQKLNETDWVFEAYPYLIPKLKMERAPSEFYTECAAHAKASYRCLEEFPDKKSNCEGTSR